MWYCKMYFTGEYERFEYNSYGTQGAADGVQTMRFLESLLSFQELDLDEYIPMLEYITRKWEKYFADGDPDDLTGAMMKLGELSNRHMYFQLLYRSWYDSISSPRFNEFCGSGNAPQIFVDLQQLPEQLKSWQKQVQAFFEQVLDVDTAGRVPQKQAAAKYSFDEPSDPALFKFQPIPLSFEPVESEHCSPVLYSCSIRDFIDYSLRSCVERGITVRRCKNCGRYFPQTGRVSAEYCERPTLPGVQTCREIGAFQQWTKKQQDEPVFKAYRKEYKKRFAWIRAGKISDQKFYEWSVKAREKKKECDQGLITLDEYQDWLKHSEI